jgi:hypothetical protein
MKADISTLHKPDILILRRQHDQIRCIAWPEKRRIRELKVTIGGPVHWTVRDERGILVIPNHRSVAQPEPISNAREEDSYG